MDKKISIIIPCKEIDSNTKKCIEECLKLDYKDFEIIVLPDKTEEKSKNKKIKIIITGKVTPAAKRNIGMKESKGSFFAFIDSDAYPKKDWLKNAMKYFEDDKIGIVGGPNLTPPEGNFAEHISGYVLDNYLACGRACIRYKEAENRFTHELPSCNYIAKKESSSKYDSSFLTAEDSEFCFTCTRKGYKILYAGNVIVYHHRRKTFIEHLKQMFIYARDIAWMTKKIFTPWYFYYSILSFFTINFFTFFFLSFFISIVRNIFLIFFCFYFIILFITSWHKNIGISLIVTIMTMLTHFSYGIGFLYGLFKRKPQ